MVAKTVKIEGLDETIKSLMRLPAQLSGNKGGPVRASLFQAARVIKRSAIANAPVGVGTPMPGLLKRSIYQYRDRDPKSSGASERYIVAVRGSRKRGRGRLFGLRTAMAYYWHFVEFGTVKQPAQRYLTRAFANNAEKSVRVFEDSLKKYVDAAVKKARVK